jgi:hypothetical protein
MRFRVSRWVRYALIGVPFWLLLGRRHRDRGRSALDKVQLYRLAVEELRFQIDLNWRRAQYYLALNLAVVGVGAGLLKIQAQPQGVGSGVSTSLSATATYLLPAGIFAVGIATAILALLANHTLRGYYHSVQGEKSRVERLLQLTDYTIRTTPGSGSKRRRFGSATFYQGLLLGLIAVIDAGGLAYSLLLFLRILTQT